MHNLRFETGFATSVGQTGQVTGLDINAAMLAVARSLPPPWHVYQVGRGQRSGHGLSGRFDRSHLVRARPAVLSRQGRGIAGDAPGTLSGWAAFEDLPPIHVVVISHDHYDHLDLRTVKRLAETHDPLFLVPLDLKAWFSDHGMSGVEELDWWQEREYHGVRFVCVPAQHHSQRTLWDGDTQLWASWAVLSGDRRFYFSGDTGYFADRNRTCYVLGRRANSGISKRRCKLFLESKVWARQCGIA